MRSTMARGASTSRSRDEDIVSSTGLKAWRSCRKIRRPPWRLLAALGWLVPTLGCIRPVTHVDVFAPNCGPVAVGDTARLSANANNPIGWPGILYSSEQSPDRFRWRSSDPGIASISPNGTARAFAPGTVTVSATTEGITGTVSIAVIEPVFPALQPVTARILVGDTIRMTASVNDEGGNPVPGLAIYGRYLDYHLLRALGDHSYVGIAPGAARVSICAANREASAIITVVPR